MIANMWVFVLLSSLGCFHGKAGVRADHAAPSSEGIGVSGRGAYYTDTTDNIFRILAEVLTSCCTDSNQIPERNKNIIRSLVTIRNRDLAIPLRSIHPIASGELHTFIYVDLGIYVSRTSTWRLVPFHI